MCYTWDVKQYIRKADIILFIVLVIIGLAASVALSLSHGDAGAGSKVIIDSGGDLYATYPLSEDRTVVVPAPGENAGGAAGSVLSDPSSLSADEAAEIYDSYNIVVISGGTVSVSEASCKNQVCVKHAAITKTGESIVCLPNRLSVRIENGSGGTGGSDGSGGSEEGGGYDSVTS